VLLIDDDELVARSIALLLEDDYDVVIECAGNQALERMKSESFELVLCDLSMPGLSGSQLYQRLAAANPKQASRMIFMTGGAYQADGQRFLDNSIQPWLAKPFTQSELQAAIARVYQEIDERSR
jgi:CheY-like chemotaxis protein